MSISFELLPTPGGWRMKPEGEIDLSHWELDYRRDRIVCTPTVSDFVLMALGTVLLGGLALVFLLVAFKPSWLGFRYRLKRVKPVTSRLPIAQVKSNWRVIGCSHK